MKKYMKVYDVNIHTQSPVFVGDGSEISKKEYIFIQGNKVGVLDIEKFYKYVVSKGKRQSFENYLLQSNDNLNRWILNERLPLNEVKEYMKYMVDCGDALDKNMRGLQVLSCMKDPYFKPYIPGTTLKGLLRTILLTDDILSNETKYQFFKNSIKQELDKGFDKTNRNTFLSNQIKNLEAETFNTLSRTDVYGKEIKKSDAVNDIMQGFIVSDSEPLQLEDLVMCQRVEMHTDGSETKLPLLRECIKPDCNIHFTVTIDSEVCKYTEEQIRRAINNFNSLCYERFSSKFHTDRPLEGTVYIGGGCGFVSKTIIQALYDEKEAIKNTVKIYEKTKVPSSHNHNKDLTLGVSPHILKCTRYKGKTYQMGVCIAEIKETHI